MMITPSDLERDIGPSDWPPSSREADAKQVMRLEFESLDRSLSTDVGETCAASIVSATAFEEEISALREQLRVQTEMRASDLEALRDAELNEAREKWEQEAETRVLKEREIIFKSLEEFRKERERYFSAVEAEIVRLALAIAMRILHREATLDPLVLSGVVRVALEKVADDSTVVLRVPKDELESWRSSRLNERGDCLQLAGDERLNPGECVLDTSVGRVELGIAAQLQEIERGFFDLLQQRPA